MALAWFVYVWRIDDRFHRQRDRDTMIPSYWRAEPCHTGRVDSCQMQTHALGFPGQVTAAIDMSRARKSVW